MARIYQPLQRLSNGRWDMTVSSDEEKWTHRLGFCCGTFDQIWKPWSSDSDSFAWGSKEAYEADRARHAEHAHLYHDNGHATPEEAERCYRSYEVLLHRREREEPDTRKQCAVCAEWTTHRVAIGSSLYREVVLCPSHCTTFDVMRAFGKNSGS